MALNAGTRVGSYEVLSPLGAGGMGEVYRARDSKLNRDVALKILPPVFAGDSDRMARFQREAQVLASLNHPNIAHLYGIEGETLVMELVEGPTLEERLKPGPLPVGEALEMARQIAEALEYAHEKGVVHRDLKPANVKLTPEGTVKVLDFGLAKIAEADAISGDLTHSPTLTMRATQAGVIMGTAGYMSPEQAAGKVVDRRADVWSFGVLLWEMLCGERLFEGETVSHTLADVLRAPLDTKKLPAATPRPIRELVGRCLDRSVKTRLQAIGEARVAIQRYLADPEAGEPAQATVEAAPPASRRTLWASGAAAGVLAVLCAGFAWRLTHLPEAERPVVRFQLTPPAGVGFNTVTFAVSPNGRYLAAQGLMVGGGGETMIFLRDLENLKIQPMTGTSGVNGFFWSHDSRSVAFFAQSKLKRAEVAGGPVQLLCDATGYRGGTWTAQGTIVFGAQGDPLRQVAASGGIPKPVQLGAPEGARDIYPVALPDGKRLLHTRVKADGGSAIMVSRLDGKGASKQILEAGGQVALALDDDLKLGYLFFRRAEGVMAVRVDMEREALAGEPFPVIENAPSSTSNRLPVSASMPARVVAFGERGEDRGNVDLVMLDRTGKQVGAVKAEANALWGHIEVSPDGKKLLGEVDEVKTHTNDIWTYDTVRKVASRVTFDPGSEGPATWSPDGKRIYYHGVVGGVEGVYVGNADGSGAPQLVVKAPAHHLHISADGKYLAYDSVRANNTQVMVYSFEKGGEPKPVVNTAFSVSWPQFSPDGKWMAFNSNETGTQELFVQSFPPGKGRWKISTGGSMMARWRQDGKELVFSDSTGRFQSVAVAAKGGTLEFASPQPLFEARISRVTPWRYFSMTPDAKVFYVNLRGVEASPNPLTVVLNWGFGLRR